MRKTIMLMLAIALPGPPADAQVPGNELFAAYCLGVFEQREKEGPASGLGEEAARQRAQTLGSLGHYLQIRIVTNKNPRSHAAALSAAKEDGTRDESECISDLCISCITIEAEPEACTRVSRCKLAPQRQAATIVSPPQSPQQQVAPVPALPRPQTRPPVVPPTAPARQATLPGAQTKPAGQCAVSRPRPGLQVYLVTCPSSWAMIGRTVDLPTDWTVSEGVNSTDAVDFFMKS